MTDKWLDRVLISRHAVTNPEGQYDEEGYCETKVPYGGSLFWMEVTDGNGEFMCAECALTTLLQQLSTTGTIPKYEDRWQEEWKLLMEADNDRQG